MSESETIDGGTRSERWAERVQPARFAACPATQVRTLNRLHRPRQPVVFDHERGAISIVPLNRIGPAMRAPYRFSLGDDVPFGPLDVDPVVVKRLVGLIDTDLAELDLPDKELELILENLLADVMDEFEGVSGYRLQPRLTELGQGDHSGKFAFDLAIPPARGEVEASRARLWVPPERILELSQLVDRIFEPTINDLPVNLPVRLEVGCCRLALQDVRALEIGDVLRLEGQAPSWPGVWLVIARKRRMPVAIEGRSGRIGGALEMIGDEERGMQSEDGNIDDLEVDLKFEIGRSHMPLRQLQKLAEGGVIPLERDFTSPVDVIVGGKRVGEGEIVDIDGRIGVRLVRFEQR